MRSGMDNLPTITCPGCKQVLMGGVQRCQFCGADVSKIAVPKVVAPQRAKIAAFETPKWVWWAYYGLAAYWIIGAIASIIFTVVQNSGKASGGALLASMTFDFISIILGLGLIFKVKIIRKIVNIFAGLQILGGLLGMLGGFIVTGINPLFGLLVTILNVLDVVFGALTIYVLSETSDNLWDD